MPAKDPAASHVSQYPPDHLDHRITQKSPVQIELSDLPNDLQEIRPAQVREKIAFLLYSRELLFHIEPVLEQLHPEDVDLIVYSAYDQTGLEKRLNELPFQWYDGRELVRSRIGYRLLVSIHVGGLEEIQLTLQNGQQIAYQGYPFRMLGVLNVRFMFSLGADDWNFQSWNQLYDAFLCYGPHQARHLASFRGHRFLMGYPRYDRFFNQPLTADEKARWLVHFGCQPGKPVLLWLRPLIDEHPGQEAFASSLCALQPDYQVLVKPHPYHPKDEHPAVTSLNKYPFTAIITESIDNLILYQLADYVIAEYGGTIYSALYTDCNLLLFDHPGYSGQASEELMSSDTDQWLRQHIPHLLPEQTGQLPELLKNAALWQAQKSTRAWLRELFFAPTYGYSAQVAATILSQMAQIALYHSSK